MTLKSFRKTVLFCALAFPVSCGPFVENTDKPSGVYVGPTQTVAGGQSVRVAETPPPNGGAELSGLSCQNKIWNPAPSEDTAILVLRREAAKAGFNSIYVTSVENDNAALLKNCWAAIIARGIAFNS